MVDLQSFSWLILVFVGLLLIVIAYILFSMTAKQAGRGEILQTGKRGAPGVCPVCGSILKKGESVKSAVYPGEDDKLCYIYGCPNCFSTCKEGLIRQCPVCKKTLAQGSHLIARYFERKTGQKRVHILGCPECRFRS